MNTDEMTPAVASPSAGASYDLQPCVCVYGPCLLHSGHCCFRSADSVCHEKEIAAAVRTCSA